MNYKNIFVQNELICAFIGMLLNFAYSKDICDIPDHIQ